MKNLLYLVLFFSLSHSISAQLGIILNSEDAFKGYTLLENSSASYLIDNCGDIVNTWEVRFTDNHAKLLPNGNLIYIRGNTIYERDWNDQTVRTTRVSGESNLMLTYEVIVLENGNYLCIARRSEPSSFFTSRGYNSSWYDYDDAIVEVVPETGQLVWEWRISDHIVQQRDSLLPNYGSPNENPQLLSVDAIATVDWDNESFMINGFDYNPTLDQIVISVRKISEIVIIDHSTTTEEAKGSKGGKYGKGGDILYRWGNPENYNRVNGDKRILYFQHNPNWIQYGPHKDKIIVYSNGLDRPNVSFNNNYSTVEIIAPDINADGSYNITEGEPYLPEVADVTYSGKSIGFFSDYTSGARMLSNGNLFVTVGRDAELIELDSLGNRLWQYNIKGAGYIFRTEKYPVDYLGFEGKDLSPMGTIESPPSTYDCNLTSTDPAPTINTDFDVDLTTRDNQIELISNEKKFDFQLLNVTGQRMDFSKSQKNIHTIDTYQLTSGLYFIQLYTDKQSTIRKVYIK